MRPKALRLPPCRGWGEKAVKTDGENNWLEPNPSKIHARLSDHLWPCGNKSWAETGSTRNEETWTPLSDPPHSTVPSSAVPEAALGWSRGQIPPFPRDIPAAVAPAGLRTLLRVSQPKSLTWCCSCTHGKGNAQSASLAQASDRQLYTTKSITRVHHPPPTHSFPFFFFFLKGKGISSPSITSFAAYK